MTTSTTSNTATQTDRFDIEVVLPDPLPEAAELAAKEGFDVVQELEGVLDGFVAGVESGAFFPGRFVRPEAFVPSRPGGLGRAFSAADLPSYAFRVLRGMLDHYAEVFVPLAFARAWASKHPHVDLLRTTAQPPPLPNPPPSNCTFDLSHRTGSAPPLEVLVEFSAPLTSEFRDRVLADLGVWVRLQQGGYSATGDSGVSALENPNVRQLDATSIRLFAEGWLGHEDGFVGLLNLAGHWNKTYPVRRIEIQTE